MYKNENKIQPELKSYVDPLIEGFELQQIYDKISNGKII